MATLARSARASRRLNLASWITPIEQRLASCGVNESIVVKHTRIGIAREVASPFDECAFLQLATGDCVTADCASHARVCEFWLRGDDTEGDVVVD